MAEKQGESSWFEELMDGDAGGTGEGTEGADEAGGSGEGEAGGSGEVTLAAKISNAVDQLAEKAVLKRLTALSSQLEQKGF